MSPLPIFPLSIRALLPQKTLAVYALPAPPLCLIITLYWPSGACAQTILASGKPSNTSKRPNLSWQLLAEFVAFKEFLQGSCTVRDNPLVASAQAIWTRTTPALPFNWLWLFVAVTGVGFSVRTTGISEVSRMTATARVLKASSVDSPPLTCTLKNSFCSRTESLIRSTCRVCCCSPGANEINLSTAT